MLHQDTEDESEEEPQALSNLLLSYNLIEHDLREINFICVPY